MSPRTPILSGRQVAPRVGTRGVRGGKPTGQSPKAPLSRWAHGHCAYAPGASSGDSTHDSAAKPLDAARTARLVVSGLLSLLAIKLWTDGRLGITYRRLRSIGRVTNAN